MRNPLIVLAAALMLVAAPAMAKDDLELRYGPVFIEFGAWRQVGTGQQLDPSQQFRAIFDTVRGGAAGEPNARFESAARYMNLLVANGVPRQNVHVAVVVHGPAIWDVTNDEAYHRKSHGEGNPSREIVRAMLAQGVQFIVCGQSALGQDIGSEDLMPGVTMALSQTVATSVLHQQGFTNIP
ncbi:DsrE family protein [Aurantiacibacter flavus]|uniref:DsrE family protein n=1 Tax=Aurantiacibacter flavus TaxID=3145232 RepID=A0ABV0CZV0_9SPHN